MSIICQLFYKSINSTIILIGTGAIALSSLVSIGVCLESLNLVHKQTVLDLRIGYIASGYVSNQRKPQWLVSAESSTF